MKPNVDIYIQALTHRSYVKEKGGRDNEQLEFLGDSVLQLCVSELLIKRYPNHSEGDLSQMRHRLVNNYFLANCARKLQLGKIIRLGKGEEAEGGRNKDRLLANTFEALLGAVFVRDGLDVARRIVHAHLSDAIETDALIKPEKQRLHEWSQRTYRLVPVYRELYRTGPAHDLSFVVSVEINGKPVAQGRGSSKKKATNEAAKKAVQILGLK